MNEKQQEVLDKINEMMDASYGCAESFVAFVLANQPRENVRWYDAVAYARS